MASKRRLRRKSCEHKHMYHTEAEACTAARRASARSRSTVRHYRCEFGRHHFHIGHPSNYYRSTRGWRNLE